MIELLFLILSNSFACVDVNKTDKENMSCILTIEKKSDISNNIISECSKLASQDKFIGYLCLCRINKINSKIDLAVSSCSKAKTKNPFSPYPHIELAEIYMLKNKTDAAITEVEFAINMDTQNFHANFTAARILEEKNLSKSLNFYKKTLDILKNSNEPFVIGKKTFIENKITTLSQKIEKIKREEKEAKYLGCIESYKKEKEAQTKVEIIEKCLQMKDKHHPSIYLEYINSLYMASRYEDTIKEIKKLDKETYEKNSKILDEILAESYFHTNQFRNANQYYKRIIKDDTYDVKILNNYAQSLEKSGDKITALEIYKKINSIKPSKKLEEKIEEIKIEAMTDEEILQDLKVRGMVDKEKLSLLPHDKKLFLSVKLIERNGAIKYLSEKYRGYANIFWENPTNPSDIRITYTGYNLYVRNISQKLIRNIEKTAPDPRDIFKVKDANGNDVFDKNGNLTYEGLKLYYEYEKTNKKNWFFPHELPLPSQKTNQSINTKDQFFLKKKLS